MKFFPHIVVAFTLAAVGCAGLVQTDYVCPAGTERYGDVCVDWSSVPPPQCVGCSGDGGGGGGSDASVTRADAAVGGDASGEADGGDPGPYPLFACQTRDSVIVLDGDPTDTVHPGKAILYQTIDFPNWSSVAFDEYVSIDVWGGLGGEWRVQLHPPAGARPLKAETSYEGAVDVADAGSSSSLYVGQVGPSACRSTRGRFRVGKIERRDSELVEFTASFEQYCEGATGALRGCVHFVK